MDGIDGSIERRGAGRFTDGSGGRGDRSTESINQPTSRHIHTHTKQLFPTFSLATIRGAGHWVHAEKPEETLQMVQRYLDEEMDI